MTMLVLDSVVRFMIARTPNENEIRENIIEITLEITLKILKRNISIKERIENGTASNNENKLNQPHLMFI